MGQVRAAAAIPSPRRKSAQPSRRHPASSKAVPGATVTGAAGRTGLRTTGRVLQQEALAWAMANCGEDGKLPSGKAIADRFGRHERWGRLVKQHADGRQADASKRSAAA
jgi:hypothetical protein